MSKSYSKAERRKIKCGKKNEMPIEPEVITPEWAIARMRERVNYLLEQMIIKGEILFRDKEDYFSIINIAIWKSLEGYDPYYGASIVTFLNAVVDNEVGHIKEALNRFCRKAVTVPIMLLPETEAAGYGYVSAGAMSDGCRGVKDLELKMDVNSLLGLLTPLEKSVIAFRLNEYTQDEIMAELKITRYFFRKAMKGIREKAKACGFIPLSESKSKNVCPESLAASNR